MAGVLPFDKKLIELCMEHYGTPFYLYDERGIAKTVQLLQQAFDWASQSGFKNFFPIKACPNPHIIKILVDHGFGVDCSSVAELIMTEKLGIQGKDILFSSNNTSSEEFQKAVQLDARINLDDITHLEYLEGSAGIPEFLSFRYNPGALRQGTQWIGDPIESKFGLTNDQIFAAYEMAKKRGVKRFGLQTMLASNVLDQDYIIQTAVMMFKLAAKIVNHLDLKLEYVSLGGGFGIPYAPEETALDIVSISKGIRVAYEKYFDGNQKPSIFMELGRYVVGPHGYLIASVRHVTQKYKQFVGLDASSNHLIRPGLFGAYHHLTVLGKESEPQTKLYDVTGSMCENLDKFAIDRRLPHIQAGDIIAIHDVGAYGYAQSYQFNGRLRCAELLLRTNGTIDMIRRAETVEDYFSTLKFPSGESIRGISA